MDGEGDCSRVDVEHGARHHFVGPIDGDGHDGTLKLLGETESTVLEGLDVPVVGASSLGEDYNRHTFRQTLLGVVHCLDDASRRVVVDHDVSCHVARPSHEREVVQSLAHHPLEVVAQIAVDGEDVVGALMIGDKDVVALAVDEVAVLNLDLHTKEEAHCPRPPLRRIISPVVTVEEASHNGDEACDDGEHEQYGRSDAVVIYSIREIHDSLLFFQHCKDSK